MCFIFLGKNGIPVKQLMAQRGGSRISGRGDNSLGRDINTQEFTSINSSGSSG